MSDIDKLITAALQAREKAYAPYSQHPVGAALITQSGHMFVGTNVENAAYPLGTCAEATAIGNMVLGDERMSGIQIIVVAGPGDHLCTPCGGCRQKIHEFSNKDTRIVIVDKAGAVQLDCTIESLLPHSFGPHNLSD